MDYSAIMNTSLEIMSNINKFGIIINYYLLYKTNNFDKYKT